MDTTNESSNHHKYSKMEDLDETADTLSLCDLPIYPQSLFDEYRSSCSDQNLFEFHSDEFSSRTNSNSSSTDSIMFCGKLIQNKQDESNSNSKTSGKSSSKRRDILNGSGDSKLSGDSNSSRWYFFMFGLSRFPPLIEMSLSDMRKRQSRRVPDPVVQSIGVGAVAGVRLNTRKGAWGMIRYLSCVSGTAGIKQTTS